MSVVVWQRWGFGEVARALRGLMISRRQFLNRDTDGDDVYAGSQAAQYAIGNPCPTNAGDFAGLLREHESDQMELDSPRCRSANEA